MVKSSEEIALAVPSPEELAKLLEPKSAGQLQAYSHSLGAHASLVGFVAKQDISPELALHQFQLAQMDYDKATKLAVIQQETEKIKTEGAKAVANTQCAPMRRALWLAWGAFLFLAGLELYALHIGDKEFAKAVLVPLAASGALGFVSNLIPRSELVEAMMATDQEDLRREHSRIHAEIWKETIWPGMQEANQLIDRNKPTVPASLLHFTDANALVSVLSSRKLWVSRAFSSNDPSELDHGRAIALKEQSRVVSESDSLDGSSSLRRKSEPASTAR